MIGRILGSLDRMYKGVAQRIARRRATFDREKVVWYHPPTEEVLTVEGPFLLEEYLQKRKNRMLDYASTRSVLGLSL